MRAEENITNLTEILADVFKTMAQNNVIDGLKYQIQLLIFEYLDVRCKLKSFTPDIHWHSF